MKIIILNGSPRKNGATAQILHKIERNLLAHDDVAVEFVHISDLNIMPCSGCCSCYKTGRCYREDDAEKLSDRISVADGLVFGSPTYVGNLSGQLKLFIDRGHFVMEQLLRGKYAVSAATGENYGSRDTGKSLNKLLQYSGAFLTGGIVHNLPFHSPPGGKALERKLDALADKLHQSIRRRKKYPVHGLVHKIIFSMGIRPFVRFKGEDYRGVVARWEQTTHSQGGEPT